MKTCFILLIAISGAVGQSLPACPTFVASRNTCATASISSLTTFRDLFSSTDRVYQASVLLEQATIMCSNQAAVKTFLTCLDGIARACVPAAYHKAMQSAQQLSAGVDYVCREKDNIDLACYTTNFNSIGTCISLALGNHGHNLTIASGYFDYNCQANRETAKCLKSVLAGCSKPNTGSILETGMSNQLPAACDGVVSSVSMILLMAVTLMNVITW